MCVHHHLPSSPGHTQESVRSAGRLVFTHCNTHHEDPAGAPAGGAAAVSEGCTNSHINIASVFFPVNHISNVCNLLLAGQREKASPGPRSCGSFL